MKPSRAVTKSGLVIVTIATPLVVYWPRIAVWLADVGNRLSAVGVKLACYGH